MIPFVLKKEIGELFSLLFFASITRLLQVTPGLFFAGEFLNVDGVTGGFNFQSAWTTGFLAGRGIASRAERNGT